MASVGPSALASPFNLPPTCRFCHASLNIHAPEHFANHYSIDSILAQPIQPTRIVMCIACGRDGRCVPARKPGELPKKRSIAELLGMAPMPGSSVFEAFAAKVSGRKVLGVEPSGKVGHVCHSIKGD